MGQGSHLFNGCHIMNTIEQLKLLAVCRYQYCSNLLFKQNWLCSIFPCFSSTLVGVLSIVLSMSVGLNVNIAQELPVQFHQIFCACYLWLVPPLVAL